MIELFRKFTKNERFLINNPALLTVELLNQVPDIASLKQCTKLPVEDPLTVLLPFK